MSARDPRPEEATDTAPIPFREFVVLMASVMALAALGLDSMLPALPAIGRELGVANPSHDQFVISAFLTGMGVAQLVHGPLADRFGRRPVLMVAIAGYVVASLACAFAGGFVLLLVARAFGGACVAASRVVSVALVRDCFSGRRMAQVMSTTFIVFMIVPVLAPTLGQAVLLFGNWRVIFGVIAGLALLVLAWFGLRMPETQHPDDRLPLSPARVVGGWRVALGDRLSLGYMLASGALLGAMYGYLNSIEQIMADVFGRPKLLTAIFAATAGTMAVANFVNSRLVLRLGTRLLSHAAVSAMIALAALHLALSWAGGETLAAFAVLQAMTMGCFGLSAANFSSLAMQNMGHIAGTASSVQGFASVLVGTALGAAIGQAFDGSVRPMLAGFVVAGVLALVLAAFAERGRLFRPAISAA